MKAEKNFALDGLRGIAVLLVMLFHFRTGRWLPGGRVGVDLFFVLSGFLITGLLTRERETTGRIDLLAFYGRRARRLIPAITVLLSVWSSLALVFGGQKWFVAGPWVLHWTFIRPADILENVTSVVTLTLNVQVANGHVLALNHLWSLMVEEQFYLIWPLLLGGLLLMGRRRAGQAALTLAVASAWWSSALASFAHASGPRLYYSTDTRAQAVLIGAAVSLLFPEYLLRLSRFTVATFAAVAAIVLAGLCLTVDDQRVAITGVITLAALSAATLVAFAVRFPTTRLLTWRPLMWLGRRCYGLYLWHYLFATWLNDAGWLGVPLGIGASLLVAEMSWRFIERPWLIDSAALKGSRPSAPTARPTLSSATR